ncbi:MAG: hypothetical protein U0694_16035 [Anaerolineae bacterium]
MSQANREQLQQIASLIKSGKKAEAAKLLIPLLKTDPNNAAGWWMMANAVNDPEHKKRALKRFLQLRPGDEKGTAMLAKLEAVVEEEDPFSDPDNPFVAAARSSEPAPSSTPARRSLLHKSEDPFDAVAGDEDDPFADAPPVALSTSRSTSRPITTNRPASSSSSSTNNSLLIIGGVVLIAIIAIGAAVLVASSRNNAAVSGDPNAYVDPIVDCDDDSSVFNENDDVGARLSSRVDNRGRLDLGSTANGAFNGSNELHGYTFNGASGQWVIIEMWSPDSSIDPQVEVYDPNGQQFAFCDDSSDSLDTYMEVRLPRSGVYTIVAQQFGLNEGSYQISVRAR